MVEGVTDYYAELLVHRAGLSSEAEYLDALANKIEELQTTPGRGVQPVDLASFDAWIKFYRPDENSPNASISYYTKGAVLAFLLDAKIRRATAGAKSLDDVMRAAFQKLLRTTRIYAGRVPFGCRAGIGRRPSIVLVQRCAGHCRARLLRSAGHDGVAFQVVGRASAGASGSARPLATTVAVWW